MDIKFTDNSASVLSKMQSNVYLALSAIGNKAVELVVEQMQSGYEQPIRQTGDLQRSITHQQSSDSTVDVGTNMEYAVMVHEGTRRMAGRPYITDAINKGRDQLQKVAETYLKQGF